MRRVPNQRSTLDHIARQSLHVIQLPDLEIIASAPNKLAHRRTKVFESVDQNILVAGRLVACASLISVCTHSKQSLDNTFSQLPHFNRWHKCN